MSYQYCETCGDESWRTCSICDENTCWSCGGEVTLKNEDKFYCKKHYEQITDAIASIENEATRRKCDCGSGKSVNNMCRLCTTSLCEECGHDIYPGTESTRAYCDYHYKNQ